MKAEQAKGAGQGMSADITRRGAMLGAALLGGLSATAASAADPAACVTPPAGPRPSGDKSHWTSPTGAERIAMVMYPGMTALDILGPHYFFKTMRGSKVDLVSVTRDPVLCDRDVTLVPTATFDDVAKDVDLLFVPGAGFATIKALENETLLNFLADRGATARWVGSICTGSLIIGAAGLLKGYRATAHWQVLDTVLPSCGAIPVKERFVVDRNRVTGAGVTAGIDFGMRMVDKFRGADHARVIQLIAEYDPQPVYNSGSPDKAWPETVQLVRDMLPKFNADAVEATKRSKLLRG